MNSINDKLFKVSPLESGTEGGTKGSTFMRYIDSTKSWP